MPHESRSATRSASPRLQARYRIFSKDRPCFGSRAMSRKSSMPLIVSRDERSALSALTAVAIAGAGELDAPLTQNHFKVSLRHVLRIDAKIVTRFQLHKLSAGVAQIQEDRRAATR